MKQGHASRSGIESTKVEPKSHAISPAGVSQIGTAVDPRAAESMHQGRGYKAPMNVNEESHHCGSQGKHR